MKLCFLSWLCFALFAEHLVSSQYEEDFREQGQTKKDGSKWYWNSTTTTTAASIPAVSSSTVESTTNQPLDATLVLGDKILVLDATREFNDSQSRSFAGSQDFIPANITRGRSSKALDIDLGLGNVREGRIINDDPGNRKLSLQGFIPIVSFGAKDDDESSLLKKSQKRIQDDNLYYNKQSSKPNDNENESKIKNYYLSGPHPPHPKPIRNSQSSYDKQNSDFSYDGQNINYGQGADNQDIFPSYESFGIRTKIPKAVSSQTSLQNNYEFYIPPPSHGIEKQNNHNNNNRYHSIGGASSKDVVKYISSENFNRNNRKVHVSSPQFATSSQDTHFSVGPKKQQEAVYAQAGPYPPEPIPQDEYPSYPASKDTAAKQFHPSGFEQLSPSAEGGYELSGGSYGFNSENGLAEEKCICVPFYMCRNGFLANNGRSVGPIEQIDERTPKKVSKRSAGGNETEEVKEAKDEPVPYAADTDGRAIGLSNIGQSCGLLRKCCRVPRVNIPGGLLPFSPDNYPIPSVADFENFPPGLFPPGMQLLPHQGQRPFQRPSHEQHIFSVSEEGYPHPSPHQEQVIIIPQEIQPNRRPQHVGPRPVVPHHKPGHNYPLRKPVNPLPQSRPVYPHPNPKIHKLQPPNQRPPHHQLPYPQPKPHIQLQPAYPQPVYNPKPQPVYPLPQPQPAYPQLQPDYSHPPPQIHHGQCGARNGFGIHGRVNNLQYHDDASEFGEYPWQAAILLKVGPGNNLFVCGGTLISSQWVATAAHCLKKHLAEELKVRLGDWDVHRDDEFYPYVEKYVTAVAPHPEFYPGNLQNDLALLKLDSPVDPSLPHISPACLPEPQERFDGSRCWVTGWGKNAFGEQGEYQSVLKEVDVPMLSHRDCEHRLKQTRLGPHYQLHPGFVCAGGEPGKDACTGDGGSPLVCDIHGTWKVAGLVSWGIGCGQPGVPGIYVNMAKYRTWMDTVISRHK